MSTWCQFCDHKMMFEKQATIVEGYVTCGAAACQLKAKGNAKEIKDGQDLQSAEKIRVCIFSSSNFEDETLWKLLHEDKHPAFLQDPKMMSHLLVGGIITIECEDGDISYCAKSAKEVTEDVKSHLEDVTSEKM